MDSAEAAWPLEKLEKQPEGDHLSLWVALLSRSFPALSLRTFPPHALEEVFVACEDKTSQKYLSLSLGLRDTVSQAQLTLNPEAQSVLRPFLHLNPEAQSVLRRSQS